MPVIGAAPSQGALVAGMWQIVADNLDGSNASGLFSERAAGSHPVREMLLLPAMEMTENAGGTEAVAITPARW